MEEEYQQFLGKLLNEFPEHERPSSRNRSSEIEDDETPDFSHLREINSSVLTPSSQLHSKSGSRCAWCDEIIPSFRPAKECSKCHCAIYCSALCLDQDKNFGGHRQMCQLIRRKQIEVSHLNREFSQANGIMDVFDWNNGMVFNFGNQHGGLGETGQSYLWHRSALVQALIKEGSNRMVNFDAETGTLSNLLPRPHWNRLALQLALEHSLDLVHLDPVSSLHCTRVWIAHSLLVLDRYQDLYDYVKYWNVLPHELRRIDRDRRNFDQVFDAELWDVIDSALGPTRFMHVKRQSMFEDQSNLALRLPVRKPSTGFPGPALAEVVCILYLALAKLLVLAEIAKVQMVVREYVTVASEVIAISIGSYLDLPSQWLDMHPSQMKRQCRELLSFAESSIPGVLEEMVDRSCMNCDSELELLKTTWYSHKKAWKFLVEYVKKKDESECHIPRNVVHQQMLDRVYFSYAQIYLSDPDYQQCCEHWERVKNTKRVQDFLKQELNAPHLCGSSFYGNQLLHRMRHGGFAESPEHCELVFGTRHFDSIYSATFVDVLLAFNHYEHVKYKPEVKAMLGLRFIGELEDYHSDPRWVITMLLRFIDTDELGSALFGDSELVGPWHFNSINAMPAVTDPPPYMSLVISQ